MRRFDQDFLGIHILRVIVQDYVASREPVGSKTLVENFRLGVSPATVRNELSWLEDSGAAENVQQGAEKLSATVPDAISAVLGVAGSFFSIFLAAFTILFGTRHLDTFHFGLKNDWIALRSRVKGGAAHQEPVDVRQRHRAPGLVAVGEREEHGAPVGQALAAGNDAKLQLALLEDSASTVLVVFRALLRLKGETPPTDNLEVAQHVATLVELDAAPFVRLIWHRRGQTPIRPTEVGSVLTGYLAGMQLVVRYLDRFSGKAK